jgi:hypothetical protein
VVPNANRTVLRAFVCALMGIAPTCAAESANQVPVGIATETVIADLGSAPAARGEPVATDAAIRGNPLWSIPIASLFATRDRPIFSPSRRPPPPPVVAAPYVPPPPQPPPAPPPEPDHPLLTLLGAVAGDTGGVGIFSEQKDKPPFNLRVGEGYQGWVLHTLRGREAIFEKNNQKATLALAGPETPQAIPQPMAGNGRGAAPKGLVVAPSPTTDPNFWNR